MIICCYKIQIFRSAVVLAHAQKQLFVYTALSLPEIATIAYTSGPDEQLKLPSQVNYVCETRH